MRKTVPDGATGPVDCQIEAGGWADIDLPGLANTAARAALDHLGLTDPVLEISLLATDDGRISTLNADFRGKPTATNVLSWPSEERGAARDGDTPIPPNDPELGDIALAWDTCLREAQEAGKPMGDHVTHLVVHGLLHLLGYDHERDADATLMERLETEILATLGVPDPY